MVSFDIKDLIYEKLNKKASLLGFKTLVLDSNSYYSFSNKLKSKIDLLSLSRDSANELNEAMSNYSFAVVLRSSRYVPYGDVLEAFREFGMKDGDLRSLSTKQSEDTPFGSFDDSIPENRRVFFYWFPVDVGDLVG